MGRSVTVLCGDGINCERETALALAQVGLSPILTHANELLARPDALDESSALVLPGGFSFGDELGSGQILALKLRKLGLERMVAAGKPVLGICNGFQILVKLGILPYPGAARRFTLTRNVQGCFVDRWVSLSVPAVKRSFWTRGLDRFSLPVRHGEGRLVASGDPDGALADLRRDGLVALEYEEDVNGSLGGIAALTDESGLVLGIMPHPEAAFFQETCPYGVVACGRKLFSNLAEYLGEGDGDAH